MSFHVTDHEVASVAAALGFAGVLLQLNHQSAVDRRGRWWARAQWAITLSLSTDHRTRRIGNEAIDVLAQDRDATVADLDVLDVAALRRLP